MKQVAIKADEWAPGYGPEEIEELKKRAKEKVEFKKSLEEIR